MQTEAEAMKKIHCVGVLVVDLLSGPIKQYPVPRVATQINTESIRIMPGGGAANTPSALARMGLGVSVFSKVGDDFTGDFVRRELGKLGVETSGICVSPRDSTPFTFVGIHCDGERTFIHTPGANVTFGLSDLDLDRVLAADYLLYQDAWVLAALDGEPGASDGDAEAGGRGSGASGIGDLKHIRAERARGIRRSVENTIA